MHWKQMRTMHTGTDVAGVVSQHKACPAGTAGARARRWTLSFSYLVRGALGGGALVRLPEAFLAPALAVLHIRVAVDVRAGVGPLRDTLEAGLAVAGAFLHSAWAR